MCYMMRSQMRLTKCNQHMKTSCAKLVTHHKFHRLGEEWFDFGRAMGRVVGGAERHGFLGKQRDVMTVRDPMRAIFPDQGKSWFESRIPL